MNKMENKGKCKFYSIFNYLYQLNFSMESIEVAELLSKVKNQQDRVAFFREQGNLKFKR
jgi:hypothetical protein